MSQVRLHISTSTWNRESNGLFDYDSGHVFNQTFRTNEAVHILRSGNHCLTTRPDALSYSGEVLASVSHIGGDRYSIQEFKGGHKLWLIAKSLSRRVPSVPLLEGSVLRFGKVPMCVKKIGGVGENKGITKDTKTMGKLDTSENNETKVVMEAGQCRICLGETCTVDNPFIAPCACDGSLKLIHLLCLREWLKSKLSVHETGSVLCYSWQSLSCELCKEPLPDSVKAGGAVHDLLDFHQADLAYLVLEDLRAGDKTLYVISLYEGDSIRVGRGHESEIRISDISVSRLHAIIKLSDGNFYLEDRNSKFGTLLQSHHGALVVSRTAPASIQVGRTVVDFSVVRDVRTIFLCCLCCFHRNDAQVRPDRQHPGETFTDNERDAGGEEAEDRVESAEGISRRSGEVGQASVA